ncbi:MAG: PIN domain-containing protein [Lachnospiraceae bacterium]|nr:PIN domain-containing protein [Lachnospiraceae bacterium]
MKKVCDANVVLRYLMHDDEEMYKKADKIIKMSPNVPLLVLSEVIYVLKGIYRIPREEITNSLIALSNETIYEDNDLVLLALNIFKKYNLDFVDCYLFARKQLYDDEVITFDKKLNNKLVSKQNTNKHRNYV